MIGHYLLTLDQEAEDDVLTGILQPGTYGDEVRRCLVGWAADLTVVNCSYGERAGRPQFERYTAWGQANIECQFDELCGRFGVERIGKAIRNRILANQARRVLSQAIVGVV